MFRTILLPLCLLTGCDAAVASSAGDTHPVVGIEPATARLALADDLQFLTALAVDGGYVYFTGGGTVAAPPDGPPGSDTFGVLRRVSTSGGSVEELWRGQGVGYAVGRHSAGMSVVTYDYATRGRTGTVRVLRADGSSDDVASWRAQGSCIGLAARDGVLYATHTAGSSGFVSRIDGAGATSSPIADGACIGKPQLLGERVFWLAGSILMQSSTASLGAAPLWTAGHALEALATDDDSPEVAVVDGDDLIAIDAATRRTRIVATGLSGTTDLAFDIQGKHVYAADAADGTITVVSLASGDKAVVVTSQSDPKGIVAGTDAIFWINAGRARS